MIALRLDILVLNDILMVHCAPLSKLYSFKLWEGNSNHYNETSTPLLFAGQGYMWEAWIISDFEPPGNIA